MPKFLMSVACLAFSALLAGCPQQTRTTAKSVPNDADGEVQKTSDDVQKAEQKSDQETRTMRREERQRENKAEEKKP